MKEYYYFFVLLCMSYGGLCFSSEMSLVSIERQIYKEIEDLGIESACRREAEARQYVKRCFQLPTELIREVNGWIGCTKEPGPSYDCMDLGETQGFAWSVPLIPAIGVALKSSFLSNCLFTDMQILCGSVLFGGFMSWYWINRQKRFQSKRVVAVSGSLYDIEIGNRYYPLELDKLMKQVELCRLIKMQRSQVLSGSGRAKKKRRLG